MRLRLFALGTAAVVIQVGLMPAIRPLGVVPDVGLMLALAVAVRLGPVDGAIVGFGTGVAVDLFLETPLGLTALSQTVVAYAAGAVHAGLLRPPRPAGLWIGLVGGAAAGLVFLGVGIIVGVDTLRDWSVLWVVARVAVVDAFVALPVFWIVERVVPDTVSADARRW